MIFTKKAKPREDHSENAKWEQKFAFLPVCVEEDAQGNKKMVLFSWYEVRRRMDWSDEGKITFWTEYRLPNSYNFYKRHIWA